MASSSPPVLSIGILAHNEAANLPKTLESLFQQSLLHTGQHVEVIVVPNGCTDATVAIAHQTLERLSQQCKHETVHWRVCEVAQADKCNAWNQFVHEFSASHAAHLCLMDADIQFLNPRTLELMVAALQQDPDLWVAGDLPIKDVALKSKKSLMERLSVQASAAGEHDICGQLYCARTNVLRGIWLPPQLPVEDGFLRAMIITNRFTSKEVFQRVRRVPEASHVFEAYTGIAALIRHEKRLIVGSTLNALLYTYLWHNCGADQDAGSLIKKNNEQNPRWLQELLQQQIQEQGWWLVPKVYLFRRFQRLRQRSGWRAIAFLPFTLLAFLVDQVVFFQANQEIHRRGGLGFWS